jgi:hypothetical protein
MPHLLRAISSWQSASFRSCSVNAYSEYKRGVGTIRRRRWYDESTYGGASPTQRSARRGADGATRSGFRTAWHRSKRAQRRIFKMHGDVEAIKHRHVSR